MEFVIPFSEIPSAIRFFDAIGRPDLGLRLTLDALDFAITCEDDPEAHTLRWRLLVDDSSDADDVHEPTPDRCPFF